eukprot:15125834-Alexandrium_andersonii.AAC.1
MSRFRDLRSPPILAFVGRFGMCARRGADCTRRELHGHIFRLLLGPCSSSFKRLKRCCVSRRADCGSSRIAALTGLERIADCTLGTSQ